MMGSFFEEFPLGSGNFNLLTPGEVDEISNGLNSDYFSEPNLSQNEINNFPSSSGLTKRFAHQNENCYEFLMVSGNWCLVSPNDVNEMDRDLEENVCEYYVPNAETSSICEYPLDSGNWYLLTPSDKDDINSGLEEVNLGENSSTHEKERTFTSSLGSIESFATQSGQFIEFPLESGNWYSVTPSDVVEINKRLDETNSVEHNSLHTRGKNFKPSLGLLENIAVRYRQNSEFPWEDEYYEEQSKVAVWLYTRPIGGRMDRATSRRHWAVVFIWRDKSATYEGMNIDGYIQPKWHKGNPTGNDASSHENKWIKGHYLGEHYLSPKEVNVAAKSNKVNGYKYFAGHTNCHYWAKVFAESLGFTVPQISAVVEPFTAMVVSLYKNAS